MAELDKDFEKLVNEIQAKIDDAARAMKEANDLAEKAGFNGLSHPGEYHGLTQEEYEKQSAMAEGISIYPLFRQIDKAGWRTSSIGC